MGVERWGWRGGEGEVGRERWGGRGGEGEVGKYLLLLPTVNNPTLF